MRQREHGFTSVISAFGRQVRRLRERAGLSQEELAHRAGLHRTYVSDIERGTRNISLLAIARLAAALGVEPSDLLKDSTDALHK